MSVEDELLRDWRDQALRVEEAVGGIVVGQRRALRLVIEGSDLVVDFSASDPQTAGAINCPYAVTVSASYFALKAFIDPLSPVNSGSYRPIRVVTKPGTVAHALPDAAVAGATGETANVMVDVVLGALSAAAPELAIAAGSGSAGLRRNTKRLIRSRMLPFALAFTVVVFTRPASVMPS